MRTFALTLALLAGLAFAADKNSPMGNPNAGGSPTNGANPEQQCQMKCAQGMQKCMEPCMPKDPNSMDKQNKNNLAGCAKSCASAQAPCIQKCKADAAANKKKGSDGP